MCALSPLFFLSSILSHIYLFIMHVLETNSVNMERDLFFLPWINKYTVHQTHTILLLSRALSYPFWKKKLNERKILFFKMTWNRNTLSSMSSLGFACMKYLIHFTYEHIFCSKTGIICWFKLMQSWLFSWKITGFLRNGQEEWGDFGEISIEFTEFFGRENNQWNKLLFHFKCLTPRFSTDIPVNLWHVLWKTHISFSNSLSTVSHRGINMKSMIVTRRLMHFVGIITIFTADKKQKIFNWNFLRIASFIVILSSVFCLCTAFIIKSFVNDIKKDGVILPIGVYHSLLSKQSKLQRIFDDLEWIISKRKY